MQKFYQLEYGNNFLPIRQPLEFIHRAHAKLEVTGKPSNDFINIIVSDDPTKDGYVTQMFVADHLYYVYLDLNPEPQ